MHCTPVIIRQTGHSVIYGISGQLHLIRLFHCHLLLRVHGAFPVCAVKLLTAAVDRYPQEPRLQMVFPLNPVPVSYEPQKYFLKHVFCLAPVLHLDQGKAVDHIPISLKRLFHIYLFLSFFHSFSHK